MIPDSAATILFIPAPLPILLKPCDAPVAGHGVDDRESVSVPREADLSRGPLIQKAPTRSRWTTTIRADCGRDVGVTGWLFAGHAVAVAVQGGPVAGVATVKRRGPGVTCSGAVRVVHRAASRRATG